MKTECCAMAILADITNFGAVDADSDSLLFPCFEDHEAYELLLKREKFLMLGRKGAGKTAIFKKLIETRKPDFFSYGHTFTDYPWEHHAKQKNVGVVDSEVYFHSWTYLIQMSLAKILLNMDQSLPYKDADIEALVSLERFIIDSYGSRDPDLTQIFRPTNKLKLKPHFKMGFGGSEAGVAPESVPMLELPRFISEVNREISECLIESANPEHEYHVSFDQLDLDFDPNNHDYNQRLIGLILACRRINLAAKAKGKKLFVSIFLRSDIYEFLQFEDKNKVTENDSARIEWDTPRTEHTLMELMERRFLEVIGDDDKSKWHEMFSGQQMTSKQTQYDYLLARTYSRPRDMIKFCNEILTSYKRRIRANNANAEHFLNEDIHAAKAEYSNYFLNEIDDELHKQLPSYKTYLELLKAIGFYQFSRDEFHEVHKRRAVELGIRESAADVLKALFRFSIIGYRKLGGKSGFGRKGGSKWIFLYLDPRARFDEEAQQIRVHYGLIEVLDLRRAQRNAAAEDAEDDEEVEIPLSRSGGAQYGGA